MSTQSKHRKLTQAELVAEATARPERSVWGFPLAEAGASA